MHIAQVGFVKGRNVVHNVARNTSCNSGWLRLVVQVIFGILIVSSFILIMLMVVGKPGRTSSSSSRCIVSNCRVTCKNAPYYGQYEEDIINAASAADIQCKGIALKLTGPTFKNFLLPQCWLWSMSSNVRELTIIGGNIKQIAPDAFMSPFGGNIRILILEDIEIKVWEQDMLVGLSNLEKLLIRDVIIYETRRDALAPVDNSLKFLDIKASNVWDPVNVTGTTRLFELSVVDFSSNIFRNNLNNGSFYKLRACKILFLNSCQIVSLGPGTFDYLESIEVLYLNDNSIATIPDGLFDRILPRAPIPRVALQENLWHCNCSEEYLRSIAREELLIVDPTCHSPDKVNGMTFTDFEGYCISNDNDEEISDQRTGLEINPILKNISKTVYMNGACQGNISSSNNHINDLLQVITSPGHQNCLLNRLNKQNITLYSNVNDNSLVTTRNEWIKPVYFIQNSPYSMFEIISSALPGYGLLWYQSSCEGLVYCVNTVPRLLKVFNVDLGNYFTFCPFNLSSGAVRRTYCVSYNLATVGTHSNFKFKSHEVIWFVCLSSGCLMCGAICVYCLIHRNPTLLIGSKRVLFVKHRSVEALILPPKIPSRKFDRETSIKTRHIYGENKIFVLPYNQDTLICKNFSRSFSVRCNESKDDSYISALEPTNEQLSEWRSNQIAKFDDIPFSSFSMIPYTSNKEQRSLPYYSFNDKDRVYEVPK